MIPRLSPLPTVLLWVKWYRAFLRCPVLMDKMIAITRSFVVCRLSLFQFFLSFIIWVVLLVSVCHYLLRVLSSPSSFVDVDRFRSTPVGNSPRVFSDLEWYSIPYYFLGDPRVCSHA
jgi:hypothetical protein